MLLLPRERPVHPFTREQILEHDREYADVLQTVRSLCRRYTAMLRRGDVELAEKILVEIREMRDPVMYQHRVWSERGRWNRFYRVAHSPRMHTSLICRTISMATVGFLDWPLSGLERDEVARRSAMCRHCGSRDTSEMSPEPRMRAFFAAHHLFGVRPHYRCAASGVVAQLAQLAHPSDPDALQRAAF
jgi:hypothetical protein